MKPALRRLFEVLLLKAEDRSATSAGRGSGRRVFVAPRLTFFLVRRRLAQFKDASRRVLFDRPVTMARQFADFRREEGVTLAEMMHAAGALIQSTLYPVAALLTALASLILTLDKAGWI